MKDESAGEDLKGRTKKFALRVIRLYSSLPKSVEAAVIGKQLLRSGTSVGAHYREAIRARSNANSSARLRAGCRNLRRRPIGLSFWLRLKLFLRVGWRIC